MTYEEIRTEAKIENCNPYFDLCYAILSPFIGRKADESWNGFDLAWTWARTLEREANVRPLLAECERLMK